MFRKLTFVAAAITLFSVQSAAPLTLNDVSTAAANTWLSAANTHVSALDPCPASNCPYTGGSGQRMVIDAWGGGAYDSKHDRFIIWGGGHGDYWGNEIYAFSPTTMTWSRLTEPTQNPNLCNDINGDGTPNSRHSYGGVAYLEGADRFFGMGGALACPAGGGGGVNTWTYDLSSASTGWHNMLPTGTKPGGQYCNCCAYDPTGKKLYWGETNNGSIVGLWSYDYTANSWAKLTGDDVFYNNAMAVDSKRGVVYVVGAGYVKTFTIANPTSTMQTVTTTGGSSLISANAIGLDYDPVSDKIVAWNGGDVYALDPVSKAWTANTASGAPARTSNGIYGRWRYVPSVNAFVTVTSTSDNVCFYKLTAGMGTSLESGNSNAGRMPKITVSPNPATGSAVIGLEQVAKMGKAVRLEIVDPCGKVILDIKGTSLLSKPFVWDLKNASQGVYLISLETEHALTTKRFIVLK
jgi:hypothetical protein